MRRIKGIGAAEGIALGAAHRIDRRQHKTPKRHIRADEVEPECTRFAAALKETDGQLERLKQKLGEAGGDTLILEAHRLILKDKHLVDAAREKITSSKINAEWAVEQAAGEVKQIFDQIHDAYFRQRGTDVIFVARQLMATLTGGREPPDPVARGAIVVASDLAPAEAAQLHRDGVGAFVIDRGGVTSHTSILARSLGIPTIVGVREAMASVGDGDLLVVDGFSGELIIDPSAELRERYQSRKARQTERERRLSNDPCLPAVTKDGQPIRLLVNVELAEEIPLALKRGIDGIGLYRTELLFLNRGTLPSEADHYEDARALLQRCNDLPVTIRTCDLAADTMPAALRTSGEQNPALGLRSIRLCLERPELFLPQLRGLLRACAERPFRLMFPKISSLDELDHAKALLARARDELQRQGLPCGDPLLGMMVEMPSSALTADIFATEVDFFAIGTNDLIQYTLAVDRLNDRVNHLYHPLHPAILRLLERTITAAEAAAIPLSVCGEMAGDPLMTALLIGLGVRELSTNAAALPAIRRLIRAITVDDARALATRALAMRSAEAIRDEMRRTMAALLPAEVLDLLAERDEDPQGIP